MKKSIIVFIGVIFQLAIWAQAPQAFNYQAVLRNTSGSIRSEQAVEMQIDIVQGGPTGFVAYSESFVKTTSDFGLVNLEIGKGVVISGTFSTISWPNGPYYLRVFVDGTEMGTSQLLSVPFALYADKAGNSFSGNYAELYNKPDLSDTANYLIAETDPLFTASIAKSITASDTARWNIAGNFSGNYNDLTNKPVILNDDNKSTAAGYQSLNSNTTGRYNSALGYQSLFMNQTGMDNTGVGLYALYANISGYYNSAFGSSSLRNNTTGKGNTAIGCGAQIYNQTGNYNTSVGFHSLLYNTGGNQNTAIGSSSLRSNTSGSFNIAIGDSALFSNTTSNKNTAIGYKSLEKCTGWDNTSIGYNSLKTNLGGFDNVAVGMEALNSNTSGNGNTAIGKNSMIGNVTGSNNTAMGFNSDVAGNVSNSTAIGYQAYVNASNKIVLGNASATTIGGYGAWVNYSDRRLKENIVYTNNLGLNFISQLKPASYNYIKDENKRRRDGLIAQDVEQTLQELGLEFSGLIIDDDADKTMNLSYAEFVIPLVNAVQELNQKNQQLQQKEEALEAALEEMKAEIELLKQAIQSK